MKGKVKFFDRTKKFGFVIPEDGSTELYFYYRDCHVDLLDMKHLDNLPVEFEIGEGPKGPQAIRVVPVIEVHQGHVKFFDKDKLFGFIRKSDGFEIYFKGAECSLSMPLEEDIAGLVVDFQIDHGKADLTAKCIEPTDRAKFEFDGRLRENFRRYSRLHTSALETWAYFPGGPQGEPAFLEKLADKALREPWSFKHGTSARDEGHGILWNYVSNTFLRLLRQDKVVVTIKDNKRYALFNTGLVNSLYLPIYLMFKASSRSMDQPWDFMDVAIAGSGSEGKLMTSLFNPLPEPASYFERTEDMLLDTKQDIHVNYEHAIIDGVKGGRYPYEWLERNRPRDFEWMDYRKMKTSDRRRYLESLAEAIRKDSDCLYDLGERLKSAKELALKRVSWNYKTAIPQYYPMHDELSFLVPLALVNRNTVDIALVVTKNKDSGSYEGRTVFPLEWAYMNARLVCRPDSDWLTTDVSSKDSEGFEGQ
ncbi:MAG: DUF3825 domain-containing protein [Flavobacteriales bacterium]|nr:DUF3825 domain-containing protein [Flavobacteriales bacterium]